MRVLTIIIVLTFFIPLPAKSQIREIYTNPNFDFLAKDHSILAILPFKVKINLRPNAKKRLKPGDLEILQQEYGFAVQSALYVYFLKQKENEKFKLNFQDTSITNAQIAKKGWNTDSLKTKTMKELADSLGVNGIISGLVLTKKPMSGGAAATLLGITFLTDVVVGWVLGDSPGITTSGNTNSVKCTIKIYDGKSGELLWLYENKLSRGVGSNIQSIINAMMRKASRKFPYEDIK